jgi:plastocyanin
MGGRGFLGTNASMLADVTLVLSIVVAVVLTIGVVMAILKRYSVHRWLQTVAVALNIVLVLAVMIGSFFKSAASGLPQKLNEAYYYTATIHGLLGVFAFLFGTFVMLRGNELVPNALKFNNYKLFMRIAYSAYMLVTALGVWVYLTWYGEAPATAVAQPQPVAQAQNELVVPMANFVFNPQDITIPVGTTVIWVNQDSAPHNAVADDGAAFKSELLSTGQEFRFTFDTVGDFPYFCELHGSPGGIDMAGTIKVVAADQAPPLPAVAQVAAPTPQPTPLPLPAQFFGRPAGVAAFRDGQARNDQVILSLTLDTPPPADQSLVAFLTTADGSAAQTLGALQVAGNAAQLAFASPNGENLPARFSRLVITQEPAGNLPAAPAGQPRFEGILPPQASQPIIQLLVEGPGLPTKQGYAVGLRVQTDELLRHTQFVADAQAVGDSDSVKRHAEHVYNLVSGSLDPQFGDRNGDGRSQNPGDGFGLLENGAQIGYIKATNDAALAAGSAPDATEAIKVHAEHVRICAENMRGWAAETRALALQLTQIADAGAAKPQTDQLLSLAQFINRGADVNGDGVIAPVPGEGGGLVVYEHAQFMAGFGLFPVN